jgi:hypothetical protein
LTFEDDGDQYQGQFPCGRFAGVYWPAVAVVTSALVIALSLIWILGHPYPAGWDEAEYNNRMLDDVAAVKEDGLWAGAGLLLQSDRSRPPAFRALALPVALLLGVSPILLRLVALAFFPLTLVFVYLAAARVAGRLAGATAVTVLAVCPQIIDATKIFGTEYPLYLATAATLYFLLAEWDRGGETEFRWLGLALALALGAWSKASFALIGGTAVLVCLLLSFRKSIRGPSVQFLAKSVILAAILACPWWLLNWREAVEYARFASGFARHSIGTGAWEVVANWTLKIALKSVGPALTLLALAVFLTPLLGAFTRRRSAMTRTRTVALWTCLLTPLPLLLLHLFGSNHNMRLLSPAFIPCAVAFGIVAGKTSWTRLRWLTVVAGAAVLAQLLMIAQPLLMAADGLEARCMDLLPSPPAATPAGYERGGASFLQAVMARNPIQVLVSRPQWDWQRLYDECRSLGINHPSIAYLGNSPPFNLPQIRNAWVRHREPVDVEWLWRYEEETLRWDDLLARLDDKTVVLTILRIYGSRFHRPHHMDNMHNVEFVERLKEDPRFDGPLGLPMGRDGKAEVIMFVRRPGGGGIAVEHR